jgi:Na+-translocating ferredoxin:NAD+ oxidoreductase RnfD subunit
MIGLWQNTFYTFGWSLLIGMIVAIIISLILTFYIKSMVGDGSMNNDPAAFENALSMGMGFMILAPILMVVGGLVYMYYTFGKSYTYGWSDAEERHKIDESKRLCLGQTWCNWKEMYK